MKASLLIFSFFFVSIAYGQVDEDVFSRLQAISNNGIDFFNVDGIEITSKRTSATFSPKNISKEFKQFKIKKKELVKGDSLLGFQNYYVFKTQEEPKGYHNNISYYFVKILIIGLLGLRLLQSTKRTRNSNGISSNQ